MIHLHSHITIGAIRVFGLVVIFLASLFLSTPNSVHGMVIRLGEDHSIEPYATVEDDLYTFGQLVTVSGTTSGDVIAGGLRKVEQSGAVLEDAALLGTKVIVRGPISGDLRGLGDSITVSGLVEEDALLFGNSILIEKDATIEGELFIIGEYVHVKGEVWGSVKIHGRTVKLEGVFHRGVEVDASESLGVIGDAQLKGDLVYSAPRKAFVSGTATVEGETSYAETVLPSSNERSSPSAIIFILMNTVASFLLIALFPGHVRTVATAAFSGNVLLNILKAFLLLFLFPIAGILLMFTIAGFFPGFVLFISYILITVFAGMFVPIAGSVLFARVRRMEGKEFSYAWIFFSVVALSLLSYFLQPLGMLVWVILFLLSLHGIALSLWKHVRSAQQSTGKNNDNEQNTTATSGEKKEGA